MDSDHGFRLTSPFARSRERPKLPVELLDLTEADYAAQLREYGYGERAIQKELVKLRDYLIKMTPVDTTPTVQPGPVKGRLFNDWARAARRRRVRKEYSDDETNER